MMAYAKNLVVCVKVGGKILRDQGGEVFIPFGSEYSILVKNLNSVRASVDISIDGRPLIETGSLVVDANSETEVERFVSNKSTGNRLKFIERTGKIEEHRGIKSDDGLIRVAFKYEKVMPMFNTHKTEIHQHHHHHYDWHKKYGGVSWNDVVAVGSPSTGDVLRGVGTTSNAVYAKGAVASAGISAQSASYSAQSTVTASNLKQGHALVNDAGITVEGSKSNQKFSTVGWFPTEDQEHVLVLKLVGDIGQNKKIEKPVTVKTKLVCSSCGTKNKSTAKFCVECGTAVGLELVA